MNVIRYILRSLWFYRKQHLALFAGTLISTAVLTGALIVGDSVRYSLKHLVDVRLGSTRHALQAGDRFVRTELAADLAREAGTEVIAVNILKGVGVNPDAELQANKLQVVGIGGDFAGFMGVDIPALAPEEVLVSGNLAGRLQLSAGSTLILRVEDVDVIPLNAPFAREAKPSVGLRLTVKDVLDDGRMGRFGLRNNQVAPYNVFLDRDYLAGALQIEGKANVLLAAGDAGPEASLALNEALGVSWKPADMNIMIKNLPGRGKVEVTSERIFIDDPVAHILQQAAPEPEKILTYLVNAIDHDGASTPYSFVSAATTPYMEDGLPENSILINDWLAADQGVAAGDTLRLDYFVVGPLRKLVEKSHSFEVRSVIGTGTAPVDSTLMPPYPGLSEAGNCRDWDTGIPIDLKKIRDKDEFYWDDYKGTPKAVISLEAGRSLWANEFGSYTAFRFEAAQITGAELGNLLVKALNPEDLGLVFTPVYTQGLGAAENSVDFGELFLSLSFFVIAAGVLLTVLLFSLQAQYRMPESGLLSAIGFSRGRIILSRLYEAALVALLGGAAGAVAGIGYNKAVMLGLNTVWGDAVNSDVLYIQVNISTILTGGLSGFLLSVAAVFLVTRARLRQPLNGLLRNVSTWSGRARRSRTRFPSIAAIAGFGGALLLLSYSVWSGIDRSASLFLSAGGLFIVGALALMHLLLVRLSTASRSGRPGILALALRNAARGRGRSVTTIALLSLGVFTIIITGANRKTFYGADLDKGSGTGGFSFWVETTMPLHEDLSVAGAMTDYGLDEQELAGTSIYQVMTLEGDDASCLNLNQVEKPRILGVDVDAFTARNAFSFAGILKGVDPGDPWTELRKTYDVGVIPAFADQTVITWSLKKKIGDTLRYLNEEGDLLKLVLAAGLDNSIFQGNILIGREHFAKNFPSAGGASVMLLDVPPGRMEAVSGELERGLNDYGIELTSTSRRLARFNAVQNTYLAVFMVLGGLGVIIGTIGLGIVIARNLLERKEELALLAAVGFSRKHLGRLVMAENLLLLATGLVVGILAAFIGILPSLLSPAFALQGSFVIWLVVGVLLSGLVWVWLPVRSMLGRPLAMSLRNE